MQIIGKEVLPIANAEHLPYDAILGKEHDLSKYPKDNQLEASNIIKKIENAVSSMSKDDRVNYLDYLNNIYTNARKAEIDGIKVELPENLYNFPKELEMENLLKTQKKLENLTKEK